MPPNKRRSLSNRYKRKRKFCGVRKQEIDQGNNVTLTRPMGHADFATALRVSHCSTPKKARLDTCSHRKLGNSSSEVFQGVATRSSIRNHGFSNQGRKEPALGLSLLELPILQSALQSCVCCMFCKSAKSTIHILKENKWRFGLAEMIILQCSNCQHETKFYSSKTTNRGRFEVNARLVTACNSLKGGRQVLASFCGMMNLPPPIASSSYSRQLEVLSSVSKHEAECQMNEAAKRVKAIVHGSTFVGNMYANIVLHKC